MKQHITSIFFILAFTGASLALSASAYAESARDAILKDKVANGIATQEKKRYVTLTVENDLFSGTDRNYTNGLRLGWFDLGAKPPGLTRKIEDMVPFFKTNETTSTFYSIGQNMFTPEDVESSVQDPNDRPWAAFLYGSMGTITLKDEGYVDELELTLGVVGPMALGEQAQKTIHSLINSTNPKGWDNQLKNEPGLMVSWQRRWPEQFKVDVGDLFLAASPHAGVTLGNIYTYGNIGGMVKLSSEHSRWDDKPLQVKPAMPGTGFFVPSDTPQWEVFAGVEGRAVARNIFLDGNTFADSHSVDKKPFVADLSAGVAFTWGPTRLSYTATYRTKEFDTQEDAAVFGGVSLGYNF